MNSPEPINSRSIRADEWMEFSEIGVGGVWLSGPGLKVVVVDGHEQICMIPDTVYTVAETYVFAYLVLHGTNYDCREIHFMRVVSGMEAAEFSALLGVSMAELKRMEEGTLHLDPYQKNALRGAMIPIMSRLLEGLPETDRVSDRLSMAQEAPAQYHGAAVALASAESLIVAAWAGREAAIGNGLRIRYEAIRPEAACCT